MYMTHWPGQTIENCGGTPESRVIQSFPKTIEVIKSLIQPRYTKYYESCYWQVQTPNLTYKDASNFTISSFSFQGSFYLYEGFERNDARLKSKLQNDVP
jgi:hypothetical protein